MQNIKFLFDGGMGTYFAEKHNNLGITPELANLRRAHLIRDIHREYLEAGCNAIKTNTFAVNRIAQEGSEDQVKRLIRAAWDIAESAVEGYSATVFADIGPITALDETEGILEEYQFVVDCFLELGATNFLFETLSTNEAIPEIARYIKEKKPESYIITSYAVQPGGFTREGLMAQNLINETRDCPYIDCFGMNCIASSTHMKELLEELEWEGLTLSIMPNAGYPTIIRNRTFYKGDPGYFSQQMGEIADMGIEILGGCCGTTPTHIRLTRDVLEGERKVVIPEPKKVPEKTFIERMESPFWNKLKSGEKVFAVELDSPVVANLDKYMSGTWELKASGVDVITIADCPVARAHMDSSIMACKVKRELNMDAMPHMTCRDRNLNATKALLLGLYAEGVRNVLLVTGDPIPSADRDEVKSVYQFNSRKLAGFVKSLSQTALPGEFHMFGALNVNARNFDVQLRLAKEKLEKGMVGFLTQPVMTERALENLKKARYELKGYILGGVFPVVSAANARYLNGEVSGIEVDPEIICRYEGLNREEGEAMAVSVSTEWMEKMNDYVDGFYMVTPFGRTGIIVKIMEAYQKSFDN